MAAPTLLNVAPSPASVITADVAVSFEITSSPGLQREMVFVRFPGAGIEEVIWDGTGFTAPYAARSTRTAITGGFKFYVIRTAAWPDSPQIAVFAFNTSAEELSSNWGYTIADNPTYSLSPTTLPSFRAGRTEGADSGFAQHDQDYYLRVAENTLDPEYIRGMQAGEGYEALQAQAKMAARVSTAILNTANGMLASYARGGAFSEGSVEFYRTAYTAGAVTVKAGTVVSAKGGRYFIVLTDAVFGSTDLGPVAVNVRGVFQDWQDAAAGQVTTPAGATIPGEIDTVRNMVQDPIYGDPSIRVRQITDVVGGRPPMLDLLARGNGIRRAPGESDASLSYRIRNLPDNITPAAVMRNLKVLLSPVQGAWEYTDSCSSKFQTAYDVPTSSLRANVFTYDDPRPRYFNATNWYADDREQWATFYVVVGKLQPIRDYGGLYDDAALDAAHLRAHRTGGRRAVGAYDLPDSSLMVSGTALGMAYDGRDVGQDALLGSTGKMMNSIRAAGIVAGLLQEGW